MLFSKVKYVKMLFLSLIFLNIQYGIHIFSPNLTISNLSIIIALSFIVTGTIDPKLDEKHPGRVSFKVGLFLEISVGQ